LSVREGVAVLPSLPGREMMEEFLRTHESSLDLPSVAGEETMFEYMVGEKGEWEHWKTRLLLHDFKTWK